MHFNTLLTLLLLASIPPLLKADATTPATTTASTAPANTAPPPSPSNLPLPSPTVTLPEFKTEGDWLVLGGIRINKATREIRVQVELALTEGILEFLLVDGKGKTYESIFELNGNKPSELNFALLLAGVEPITFAKYMDWVNAQTAKDEAAKTDVPRAPLALSELGFAGNALIEIQLFREGQLLPWDKLVASREGKVPPRWYFVVTGGFFTTDGRFAGDMNLSYIALWRDPSAPINFLSREGNPYRGPQGFAMNNSDKSLSKGMKFELSLLPAKP
ncbi:MAG: hypothetical protein SFY80_13140 [Verrucomicrobiota bacterium]|nr:hypothetical protein [Verrucomicrobiota bacterium]